MNGTLVSRENTLDQMNLQSTEDLRSEFRKLEKNISAGEEKTVDAYFRFLCFMSKNQRQLTEILTAAYLKPHCQRLYRELVSHHDSLNNDPKFIQCLIWLAQFNPRMYKDLVEKNIGDRLAVTYVSYSRSLVRSGRADEAIAILKKGIEHNALPLAYLEDTLREIQAGSALQAKENRSLSITRISTENSVFDPHQRFVADARDFGPEFCRTYDFKAVYPEFHKQEFQFEERRVQRWRLKQKEAEHNDLLKTKDDEIMNLRAIIKQLQDEKLLLQTLPKAETAEPPSALELSKRSELFDELTDTVPLVSTQKPPSQAECEVSVVNSQPTQDATAAISGNKTEMMTRDMRELFWNGTLDSTNLPASAENTVTREDATEALTAPQHSAQPDRPKLAIFEENSAPQRIAVYDENEHKRKANPSPAPAKRFAVCTDENRPSQSSHRATGSPMPKMKTSDENPAPPFDKDDEDKENVAPRGYQQPAYHSRRTSGILVDAVGFETAPIPAEAEFDDDDDLGVTPLDDVGAPTGRAASTPSKSAAPDLTWRVTEILSREAPLIGDNSSDSPQMNGTDRRLSTILEASKESGSSGSSNSLGTPSVARISVGGSSENEDSLPTLNPIVSDPFNLALRNKVILGSKMSYETITEKLPLMKKKCTLEFPSGYSATIQKMIGQGGYAKVYFAERHVEDDDDVECEDLMTTCIVRKDHAAIKITNEISAGLWEFYILQTIFSRLSNQPAVMPCIRKSIPEPHCAAYYTNGFLMSLPYLPYGSLVDIVNKFNREVPEIVARYLIIELMVIVMRLHENGIIHGDLKPDNVLFRKIPSIQMIGELRSKTQCLCLIDFGRAIDLKAYSSANTRFSHIVNEDIQKCVAMREQREWLFDFDWFGVANCAHSLLFGEYIEIEKTPSGDYSIKKRLPRYWNPEWWNMFFQGLLNMTAATSRPDHVDYPIKNIIELGGSSLNNKECMKTLSLKLIQLNSLLRNPKA